MNFYPRPLRGGRLVLVVILVRELTFLSTPSARRATVAFNWVKQNRNDFYPRPLRGGRPSGFNTFLRAICISIHALCEEGDFFC